MTSKHPSLLSDLGTSLVSQAVVVAGNIATLRLAAQCMDAAQVGEFALVRRVVAFVAPLLMLGLGVGLPRFLGRTAAEPNRQAALAIAGWILVLPTTLLAVACLTVWPHAAATLFFGTAAAAELARPLALLIVGNQAFLLVFATLRGELRLRTANLLQAAVIGVLPILIMLALGSRGARPTLSGIAVVSLLVTTCMAVNVMRRAAIGARRTVLQPALRELGGYGLVRVPGDLAIAGLYALGPIFAAHALDLRAAGTLAIGLSLVTALSAAFTPLGTVLLPHLSGQLVGPEAARVRARMPFFVGAALHAASFLAIAGVLFGNDVLRHFLGPQFTFPPLVLAFLVAGAAGNVLFVILRSVLDAETTKPLNAIHAVVALGLLLAAWGIATRVPGLDPLLGICAAVAIGLIALGVMTLAATVRRFALVASGGSWTRGFVVLAVTLGCGVLLHGLRMQSLAALALSLVLLTATWIAALRFARVGWWAEIERAVVARRRRLPLVSLEDSRAVELGNAAHTVPASQYGTSASRDLEVTVAAHE